MAIDLGTLFVCIKYRRQKAEVHRRASLAPVNPCFYAFCTVFSYIKLTTALDAQALTGTLTD